MFIFIILTHSLFYFKHSEATIFPVFLYFAVPQLQERSFGRTSWNSASTHSSEKPGKRYPRQKLQERSRLRSPMSGSDKFGHRLVPVDQIMNRLVHPVSGNSRKNPGNQKQRNRCLINSRKNMRNNRSCNC